jgi:hypothetical protein
MIELKNMEGTGGFYRNNPVDFSTGLQPIHIKYFGFIAL